MRPGLLFSIMVSGAYYSLLFLHLASGYDPRGMGLRDDMLERAIKFRKALDVQAGGRFKAHYLFPGDLNTTGMEYPLDRNIAAVTELRKWDNRARRYYGMRRLEKTRPHSWSGGSDSSLPQSNLDHAYATKHLRFKQFTKSVGTKADVDARGWVDATNAAAQDAWIDRYSDHSLPYFEVQKV